MLGDSGRHTLPSLKVRSLDELLAVLAALCESRNDVPDDEPPSIDWTAAARLCQAGLRPLELAMRTIV